MTLAEWLQDNPDVHATRKNPRLWRIESVDAELWHLQDFVVRSQSSQGVSLRYRRHLDQLAPFREGGDA